MVHYHLKFQAVGLFDNIMKILKLSLAVGFLLSVLSPLQSLACACCAEKGTYKISTVKPDDYILGELRRLKIGTTNLYSDAGYPETIKGLNPLGETFTASCLLSAKKWKFDFKDNNNKSGRLDLPLPATYIDYRVDLQENEEAADATLYREFRFKWKTSGGTGIFQKGVTPATDYFLVLQGRGNNCTSAETFTHWRLEITGAKADYSFYGKLKTD
jgi:hypothetical protein